MKIGKFDLTPLQWLLVILLAAPPVVLVIGEIGPGRWANELQDALFGGHSGKLSVLAVMFLEFTCLAVVAVAVRRITGRTLAQLFAKKAPRIDSKEERQTR